MSGPALQCPECGERQPLEPVRALETFRCRGCGRALKVPSQLRVVAPAPAAAHADGGRSAAPPREGPGTRLLPPLRREEPREAPLGPAPLLFRFLVWVVAVPVGFVLVLAIARWFGLLTTTELENTFIEASWSRFVPLARLLPFAALAIAGIAHLSIVGIERWRGNRLRRRAAPAGGAPTRPGRSGSTGPGQRRGAPERRGARATTR